ncbi:Inhibitor of carbonic anhydrase [Camelus dromedarius]|uniref:Inhibitor of carbonic anhydrase n=1 Tax=Camelus dromedarius TaxID=9838 RepID=A0A5N4EKQ0_CAMDR|nr:Inhibitor of carbonic anhydrase [Camelus dromedarius]
MRLAICVLLCAGSLGLCLAVFEKTVRWCVVSSSESEKCSHFRGVTSKLIPLEGAHITCIKRDSYLACLRAIEAKQADAVTVEGSLLIQEGLATYNLKPIVAEFYGSKDDPQTHHYVVAVVKKGSNLQLGQLQGRKTCHTGLGWSAGWNTLIRGSPSDSLEAGKLAGRGAFCLLLQLPTWIVLEPYHHRQVYTFHKLQHGAPDNPPFTVIPVWLDQGNPMSNFFEASCMPCMNQTAFPKLCQLCAGKGTDKCACNSDEPYFGYSGAFRCLQDGAGDVSFVRHMTVFENLANKADRDQYELLCRDNTRKPVDEYKECHLVRVPSHAVVARSVGGKEDLIWELLNQAQEHFGKDKTTGFQLFHSPHGKDLLFTDATQGLLRVPPKMDTKLYLGYEYVAAIERLRRGAEDPQRVMWCAVSQHEKAKCDEWSALSGGILRCTVEETTEDCIAAIVKGEADAMTLDGGFVYIAGKCGLVPVLAENYLSHDGKEQFGSKCVNTPTEGYYVVAVVKKSDADLTWNSLQGKKSCHGAVGTSAGWHVPMGFIHNQTGSCKLASSTVIRCLVEKGDVAFVKHSTVLQNTDGKNPEAWAKGLKKEDFQLLCLDGTRKPVTEAQNCHLAIVPSHAVVSRKDKADFVRRMLFNQQELFGRNGFEYRMFQLFKSPNKDLLFSDDTECLAKLQDKTTYQKYLGPEYLQVIANMRQCLPSGE